MTLKALVLLGLTILHNYLGIEKKDPRRIEAAIVFAFNTYSFKKGDTYLTKYQLSSASKLVLGDIEDEKN